MRLKWISWLRSTTMQQALSWVPQVAFPPTTPSKYLRSRSMFFKCQKMYLFDAWCLVKECIQLHSKTTLHIYDNIYGKNIFHYNLNSIWLLFSSKWQKYHTFDQFLHNIKIFRYWSLLLSSLCYAKSRMWDQSSSFQSKMQFHPTQSSNKKFKHRRAIWYY